MDARNRQRVGQIRRSEGGGWDRYAGVRVEGRTDTQE